MLQLRYGPSACNNEKRDAHQTCCETKTIPAMGSSCTPPQTVACSLCNLLNKCAGPLQCATQQLGCCQPARSHSWGAAEGRHGCCQGVTGHCLNRHNLQAGHRAKVTCDGNGGPRYVLVCLC